jgi:hypothetical protein
MPSDPPRVTLVPVKRYDINLSLHDILTPLIQFSTQPHVVQAATATPEVQQHALELGDLARQLRDVVGRLNAIDPGLLSPGSPAGPPDTSRKSAS